MSTGRNCGIHLSAELSLSQGLFGSFPVPLVSSFSVVSVSHFAQHSCEYSAPHTHYYYSSLTVSHFHFLIC